jgi:hypothetical protein
MKITYNIRKTPTYMLVCGNIQNVRTADTGIPGQCWDQTLHQKLMSINY